MQYRRNLKSLLYAGQRGLNQTKRLFLYRNFTSAIVQAPQETSEGVFMTEEAARRLSKIREKSGQNNLTLRLEVQGGGCKGFEYVFTTSEESGKDDDFIFDTNGEKLLVDDVSFDLVKGSQVDFTQDLIKAAFEVINNPNAEGSCGCGTSFTAKF